MQLESLSALNRALRAARDMKNVRAMSGCECMRAKRVRGSSSLNTNMERGALREVWFRALGAAHSERYDASLGSYHEWRESGRRFELPTENS